MLPYPLTLLIILYPQKATMAATEIFLSEQLQIQKPKKNVYTRDIPLPFSHRSRPSCPPKKNCVTFGFHKYTGWSFLFPIFVKASTTYTYFRKAEAERCFCIILIIIQIFFWYIPSFLENKIDIDQGIHKVNRKYVKLYQMNDEKGTLFHKI